MRPLVFVLRCPLRCLHRARVFSCLSLDRQAPEAAAEDRTSVSRLYSPVEAAPSSSSSSVILLSPPVGPQLPSCVLPVLQPTPSSPLSSRANDPRWRGLVNPDRRCSVNCAAVLLASVWADLRPQSLVAAVVASEAGPLYDGDVAERLSSMAALAGVAVLQANMSPLTSNTVQMQALPESRLLRSVVFLAGSVFPLLPVGSRVAAVAFFSSASGGHFFAGVVEDSDALLVVNDSSQYRLSLWSILDSGAVIAGVICCPTHALPVLTTDMVPGFVPAVPRRKGGGPEDPTASLPRSLDVLPRPGGTSADIVVPAAAPTDVSPSVVLRRRRTLHQSREATGPAKIVYAEPESWEVMLGLAPPAPVVVVPQAEPEPAEPLGPADVQRTTGGALLRPVLRCGRGLRLCTWNVVSLERRLPALLLVAHCADVFLLTETRSPSDRTLAALSAAGFDVFCCSREDRGGGGVVIACRRDACLSSRIPVPALEHVEAVAVEVVLASGSRLRIAAVYIPPGGVRDNKGVVSGELSLLADGVHADVIGGDFNASHRRWSRSTETGAGRDVFSFVVGSQFVVANTVSATPTHRAGGVLDLFLVRAGIPSSLVVYGSCLGSDHFPVFLGLDDCVPLRGRPGMCCVAWHRVSEAHWNAFTATVEGNISNVDCRRRHVDTVSRNLDAVVRDAMRPFPRGRMTDASFRVPAAAREAWKRATAAWKKGDRVAGDKAESEFRDLLTPVLPTFSSGDPRDLWRLWREEDLRPPRCPLQHGSTIFRNEKEQAEAFADLFAAKHAAPDDILAADLLRWSAPACSCAPRVTLPEVEAAIADQCSSGAVDPFGIPPQVLQHLSRPFRLFLAGLFTRLLVEGVVPAHWRMASVIPLLKAGKDPFSLDGYRPVALTSLWCRLLERVILRRLVVLLSSRQYGAKQGSSVEIILAAALRALADGNRTSHREGSSTAGGGDKRQYVSVKGVMVAVDLSDAFCTVLRGTVCARLAKAGVPLYLVRWIFAFLSNRRIRVLHRGILSSARELQRGGPQGAVLLPLVWAIFVDPLIEKMSAQLPCPIPVDFAWFVDDLSIWASSSSPEAVQAAIQPLLDAVTAWAEKHAVKVSTKTCALLTCASRSALEAPSNAGWAFPLRCGDVEFVPLARPIRLLGVIVDCELRFEQHVESVVTSTLAPLEHLRRLGTTLSSSALRQLYCGIGLSRLVFGAVAWWLALSATAIESLEIVHRSFCRVISGCIGTTRISSTLAEARFPSLATVVSRLGVRWACHLVTTEVSASPARHFLMSPLEAASPRKGAKTVRGKMPRCFVDDVPRTSSSAPRFAALSGTVVGPAVRCRFFLEVTAKRSDDVAVRLAASRANIARAGPLDATIFCDGSVTDTGAAGVALLTGTEELVGRICAKNACSFVPEFGGISGALDLFKGIPEGSHVGLCSDGLSVLEALKCGPLRQRTEMGRLFWAMMIRLLPKYRVSLIFVLGHCGLPEADRADVEAKRLARLGGDATFPEWWCDTARQLLAVQLAEQLDADFVGFRASVVPKDKWLLPFPKLGRRESRLLAQVRSGCVGALGGWRHERPEPCPHCKAERALCRNGGAVTHMFSCPAEPWPSRRAALGLEGCWMEALVSSPAPAMQYVTEFVTALQPKCSVEVSSRRKE